MSHPLANRHGYAPVGAVVFSSYWQEHYTVLSHNEDESITVQWHGDGRWANPSPPRQTTHRTLMDARDRVVRMLPQPCCSCGWQYPQSDLDAAARGEITLDTRPTHACGVS